MNYSLNQQESSPEYKDCQDARDLLNIAYEVYIKASNEFLNSKDAPQEVFDHLCKSSEDAHETYNKAYTFFKKAEEVYVGILLESPQEDI